jgi:pilus assembly protein Flp/PilA
VGRIVAYSSVREETPVIPTGQRLSEVHRPTRVSVVDFSNVGFLVEESPVKNFTNHVVRFLKDESGPTAVEYAIMLALIVIVCIGTIANVGTQANARFNVIANTLR